MTDAEWQALDARIAREVMKYEAKPYRGGWVYCVPSAVHAPTIMHVLDWQPHKDVAQALRALDTLLDKDADMRYTLRRVSFGYWCILHNSVGWPAVRLSSSAESTLARAICLAIEKWLDAQGPPDVASGQTDSATHRREG